MPEFHLVPPTRAQLWRRRLVALAFLAASLAVGVSVVQGGDGAPTASLPALELEPGATTPSASTPPADATTPAPGPTAVAGSTPAATTPRVRGATPGDLVITGIQGLTPSPALLARVRRGQVAGVILMGRNIRSPEQVRSLTSQLQRAAKRGGRLPLLITVDQEGGEIRRFATAHPTASARGLGRMPVAAVQRQGLLTGRDLRDRGANVDLAPVADVPTSGSNFLERRTFATTAGGVSESACAFATGLIRAGVAPTLKHFPGLGGARAANTDLEPVSINLSLSKLRQSWAPYRACGTSPGTLVMLSNAAYPALTGSTPAALSRAAYDAARDLGVTGPLITDAMEARGLAGQPNIASRAAIAGADLVLFTTEAAAIAGHAELVAMRRTGRLTKRRIRESAARVRQLRAALGDGSRPAGPAAALGQ